jgi:Spy/CpxP family protein refolding chaperone
MTRVVVIIGFLVAFAAGFVIGTGRLGSRSPDGTAGGAGSTTRPSGRDRGWMERELNLNSEQKEQMRAIWADFARGGPREHEDKRRQLRRQRDEEIAALVRPENMAEYDQIQNRYDEAVAALDKEMRRKFEERVKQTKEILNPEQREKYEKIFKDRERDRDGKDRGGKDHDGHKGDERATSSRPN